MDNPAKWKEVFDKCDLDKSGEISTRELVCVFFALGKTDEEAKDLSAVSSQFSAVSSEFFAGSSQFSAGSSQFNYTVQYCTTNRL